MGANQRPSPRRSGVLANLSKWAPNCLNRAKFRDFRNPRRRSYSLRRNSTMPHFGKFQNGVYFGHRNFPARWVEIVRGYKVSPPTPYLRYKMLLRFKTLIWEIAQITETPYADGPSTCPMCFRVGCNLLVNLEAFSL